MSKFAKAYKETFSVSKAAGKIDLFGALGSGLSAAGINPIVAGIAAIGVILAGVGAIIKHINEAPAKAAEQFQTSFSKWQTSSSELESINTQLSETNTQIASLEAQPNLTFAEQSELDRLKKVSDELRVQKQMKAQIADADAKQAAKDAANALDKNKGWLTNQGEIETARNRYNSDLSGAGKDKFARNSIRDDYISTAISNNSNDMDSQIVAYEVANKKLNKLKKDLKKAIREGDTTSQKDISDQIDSVNGDIDSIKQNAANVASELTQMNSDIAQLPESELKANKKLKDYYDRTAESIREYQKVFDPDAWRENTVADVMGSDESFDKMRQGLENMAKANGDAGVSVEQLQSKYPKLASALSKAGINLTDYVSDLNASVKSANESADALDTVRDSIESSATSTSGTVNGIKSIQSLLASQTTGKSVSYDDLNTDELKDYASALEYVNGSMQINADKAREIAKAKSEEQIELNNTSKALSQQDYLQNAAKIESLRKAIATSAGTESQAIQGQIDSLLAQNDAIAETCAQYDLLNASITEAMGAYQNWINSQNAAQTGDMFDGAQSALKKINDTLNKPDSDSYGRVGRSDYKAAIDFVIPDSVDSTDTAAVNSYLNSIDSLFTHDSNGERAGLNIENFCKEATEKGLMVLDEAGDGYKIAGGKTMQDFADGMNLAMPFVQSVFGEMQEFGATFDWADEAPKTMGDLAVAAGQAAESIRGVDQFKDLSIKMDVSDIDTAEGQIQALDSTISEMETVKSKVAIDSSEAQEANAVIAYCLAQKQALSQPDVMRVDTSQVSGAIGEAIGLLQQFQAAQNNLEIKQKVGADTSEAEAQVQSLASQIQGLSPDVKANLSLDTTSVSSIQASINGLTAKMMVDVGIKDEAVQGYIAQEKNGKGKVTWTNDSSKVDAYAGTQKSASGKVTWYNDVANVKTTFTATGTVNWTNTTPPSGGGGGKSKGKGKGGGGGALGTAHASGTAKASGDWGTKVTQKTLVGELGTEIVVSPRSGRWYTVGDNGAEMVDIPKDSIIFNHIQSEEILKNGYTLSRGTALASGTAAVNGKIPKSAVKSSSKKSSSSSSSKKKKSSSSSKSKSSGGSGSNSSSKAEKAADDALDWFEVLAERTERVIKWFGNIASSAYKRFTERMSGSAKQMSAIQKQMDDYRSARSMYEAKANEVQLSEDLKQKVRDGAIEMQNLDENTKKSVETYKKYYESVLKCDDAVRDLEGDMVDAVTKVFDIIESKYEKVALMENSHRTAMLEARIDSGDLTSDEAIFAQRSLAANQNQRVEMLRAEAAEMQKVLDESNLQRGTEAFAERQKQINELIESASELENKAKDSIKEIFDLIEEKYETILGLESEHKLESIGKDMDQSAQLMNEDKLSLIDDRQAVYLEQRNLKAAEYKALVAELNRGLANGSIKRGSKDFATLQKKVNECAEDMQDLRNKIEEIGSAKLDVLNETFDNFGTMAELYGGKLSSSIMEAEGIGYEIAQKYLEQIGYQWNNQASLIENKIGMLSALLTQLMSNGDVVEGDETWWKFQATYLELDKERWQELRDAEDDAADAAERAKEAEELAIENADRHFDFLMDRLKDVANEAEFFVKLMGEHDLFDKDSGKMNERGLATMAMLAQQYNTEMYRADRYAEEAAKLEDSRDEERIERRVRLIEAQRESILAAQEQKQAIKNLVKDGIDTEIDALNDLISKYEKGLDSAKDLYSYQKNVAKQTKNLAKIQKQLRAYSGDYSEETRAKIQKLNEQLADAQAELEETQMDRLISSQKSMLDDLKDDYEKVLNKRLDNIDAILQEAIAQVNAGATTIDSTIKNEANEVGYTISKEMDHIWDVQNGILSVYGSGFDGLKGTFIDQSAHIIEVLNGIIAAISGIKWNDKTSNNRSSGSYSGSGFLKPNAGKIGGNGNGDGNGGNDSGYGSGDRVALYRLYNPNDGDHYYTVDEDVKDSIAAAGWRDEGSIGDVSETDGVPVYSVYNPNGAHIFTTSTSEVADLVNQGWRDEGPAFYAPKDGGKTAYRLYNPNSATGAHVITTSASERNDLIAAGWRDEGDAFNVYKKGGKVDYTGPAWVDGTPSQPEAFLNANDTKNFDQLKTVLANIASGNNPFSSLLSGGRIDVPGVATTLPVATQSITGGDTNVQIDVSIDHVLDYNDFIDQMAKDKNAERLIQSMTIDRINGGSSLAKNKFRR